MEGVKLKDKTSGEFFLTGKPRPGTPLKSFANTAAVLAFLKTCQQPDRKSWKQTLQALNIPGVSLTDDSAAQQSIAELVQAKKAWVYSAKPRVANHNSGNTGGATGPTEVAELGGARGDKPVDQPDATETKLSPQESDAPATSGDGNRQGAQPVEETETRGCPISMVSGEEVLQLTDALLPGPLAFAWNRTYRSSHSRNTGLGCGWTHAGTDRLEIDGFSVNYFDDEGRTIPMKLPSEQQETRYLPEAITLQRLDAKHFLLKQNGKPDKLFDQLGETPVFRLRQLRHPAYRSSLRGVREEQGYCIDFSYNANNNVLRIEGNWGKAFHIVRDDQDRVVELVLQDEKTALQKTLTRYHYDDNNDLIAQRNADDEGEDYEYNNHLFTRRILITGFSYYYQWDANDSSARCTRTWGDNGVYDYSFKWDPDNSTSYATDSRGYTSSFQYNEYGQIVLEIDNEGGEHHYSYLNGRKVSYIDPLGHTTRYFFDPENNPAGETDALNQQHSIGYFRGKPTRIKEKDGNLWRYEYSSNGLVETATDPAGKTTHYSYNANGLVNKITQPDGRANVYHWNKAGQLTAIVTPEGLRRYFYYDAWGQIKTAETRLNKDEPGPQTHFEYNALGQVIKTTAPSAAPNALPDDVSVNLYEYNENAQLVRHSDPRGRVTQFEYDGLSQVKKRIDREGNSLRYEYDTERNLTTLINENGERYSFVYDGNERLIKEVGFDGRIQHYKYNAAGHLIKHMDGGSVITRFERDALGRMTTKVSASVANPEQKERSRYVYDAKGRLKETYNTDQYLSFDYNIFGTLEREHHCDINDRMQKINSSAANIQYQTQWPGIRTGMQLPNGESIGYAYDERKLLQDVSWNGERVTQIERDVLGRETRRDQGELSTFRDYDPSGRLAQQVAVNRNNKSLRPIVRQYQYDDFGNLSQINEGGALLGDNANLNRNSPGQLQTRYIYDLLDRLKKVETQADGSNSEHFAFDPASNLVAISEQKPNRQTNVSGNRLAMQGDKKFEYDKRGNLIKESRGKDGKLVTEFEYNLQNQLVKVQRDGQATHYSYDPLGRRIKKRDTFGETHYLWAGDQLVQETRNSLKKTYIFEPESFNPVALVENDELYHYHLDHLGTPRELSDSSGKIVWKAHYKTYGNVARQEVEEVENNLRFQGQYFDEETGLHYNRHRYYNPGTGQFISQDPIGLLGGVNCYQYAPNPVHWVDPFGLSCKEQKYSNTKEMLSKYEGEGRPGHPEWSFFGPDVAVTYLAPEQRNDYEVGIENGLLVHKGGSLAGRPVDTLDAGDAWSGTGKAIFVMDTQGKIYLSNSYPVAEFHHSSFLAGAPVASAGMMNVANGMILEVSNDSGHYQPPQSLNDQVMNELRDQGLGDDSLKKIERPDYDG